MSVKTSYDNLEGFVFRNFQNDNKEGFVFCK